MSCPGRNHGKYKVMRKVQVQGRSVADKMLEKKGGTYHEDPYGPLRELPLLNPKSKGKLLKCFKQEGAML